MGNKTFIFIAVLILGLAGCSKESDEGVPELESVEQETVMVTQPADSSSQGSGMIQAMPGQTEMVSPAPVQSDSNMMPQDQNQVQQPQPEEQIQPQPVQDTSTVQQPAADAAQEQAVSSGMMSVNQQDNVPASVMVTETQPATTVQPGVDSAAKQDVAAVEEMDSVVVTPEVTGDPASSDTETGSYSNPMMEDMPPTSPLTRVQQEGHMPVQPPQM